MKYVLLLTLFYALEVKSQTASNRKIAEIESNIFVQLNEYRNKHGLHSVTADTTISRIARLHARYLAIASEKGHNAHHDKLPHDEQFDIPNYHELNFEQRSILASHKNISCEISIQRDPMLPNQSIKEFAIQTIKAFDSSPSHKEVMLMNDVKGIIDLVGIAVVKHDTKNELYEHFAVNIDFGYYQIEKK